MAAVRFAMNTAARDARFKVFHKENGGVSSARNLGIDNAQGEWICFVDSDDFIGENFLWDLHACLDANSDFCNYKLLINL
uniref:CAZy families GT2 protein n=1 Tax=uncultured Fibrobacter sp. TaxID=261512 RepID=A0A060C8D2_9BACT|nr:CAZy families GT2 protein [uncultured Fibrobacter sp.]